VVFQLDALRATRPATHKRLATALGLDQPMYAFPHIITYPSVTMIYIDIPDALTHLGLAGDFAVEIGSEFAYFASRLTGRPPPAPTEPNFGQAFGVEGYSSEKGEREQGGGALPDAEKTEVSP
jgi:hypothetical protein